MKTIKLEGVSVWHPRDQFGNKFPHMYKDTVDLEQDLRRSGLWPLRNGWKIVDVKMEVAVRD